eukprot:Nk52_evm45s96 gene=Nk52_evmTU45s96
MPGEPYARLGGEEEEEGRAGLNYSGTVLDDEIGDYENYGLQKKDQYFRQQRDGRYDGERGEEEEEDEEEEEVLFVRDDGLRRSRKIHSMNSSVGGGGLLESSDVKGGVAMNGDNSNNNNSPYGRFTAGDDEEDYYYSDGENAFDALFTEDAVEGQEMVMEMEEQYSPMLIFCISYFVTIATILGTGILGLPVKLTYAGFGPFVTTFSVCVVMQCLLVCYFTELLQRATQVLKGGGYMSVGTGENAHNDIQMQERLVYRDQEMDLEEEEEEDNWAGSGNEDFGDGYDAEERLSRKKGRSRRRTNSSGSSARSRKLKRQMSEPDEVDTSPNLHRLGELFLAAGTQRIVFMISVFLHFASTLISYTLAGSEAYAQIIQVNYYYVIPFFSFFFTLAILLAKNYIEQIVSVLTFFKGSLLVFTVVITAYVGSTVRVASQSDWTHIGDPYLLGTVALGGVVNVMPMVYAHVPQQEHEIRIFRRGILFGTITCFVLNILWCYAVLEVVPQCNDSVTSAPHPNDETTVENCDISLSKSEEEGEIATVPLTEVMERDHKEFVWIATVLTYFITLSVTVSFLTMGSAFRHALEGTIHAIMRTIRHPANNFQVRMAARIPRCLKSGFMVKFLIFASSYGFIFVFSMFDPKGFLQVLEKATSMALNLESGVFVVLMLRKSRSPDYGYLPPIPLPLPDWIYGLNLIVMSYFVFAVVYDLVVTTLGLFIQSEYLN